MVPFLVVVKKMKNVSSDQGFNGKSAREERLRPYLKRQKCRWERRKANRLSKEIFDWKNASNADLISFEESLNCFPTYNRFSGYDI
jgi:hypothetical protein